METLIMNLRDAIQASSEHIMGCSFCNGTIRLNGNFISCVEGEKLTELIERFEDKRFEDTGELW